MAEKKRRKPGEKLFEQGNKHLDAKEWEQAIECYKAALRKQGFASAGDAWNRMGIAYAAQGKHDQAIECYQKALKEKSFDTPGHAWFNMGNSYAAQEKYDQAIECYQKALKEKSFDTPGHAWFNMGNSYAAQEKYDQAIACYQKALEEKSYDTPGNAWNNMGLSYADQGNHDQAIECFQQALKDKSYNTPEKAHWNIGEAFFTKQDYPAAIEHWTIARKIYTDQNSPSMVSFFDSKIEEAQELAQGDQPDEAMSAEAALARAAQRPEGKAVAGRKGNLAERRQKLAQAGHRVLKAGRAVTKAYFLKDEQGSQSQRDLDLSKSLTKRPDNFFINLKGWSSNLPLVADVFRDQFNGRIITGGGYFIKWQGSGIVIDPGLNFLDNFHRAGFHISEVDLVLITHCHLDHIQDLSRLLDLIREYRERDAGACPDLKICLDHSTYTKDIEAYAL